MHPVTFQRVQHTSRHGKRYQVVNQRPSEIEFYPAEDDAAEIYQREEGGEV